jgi:hypothetical protein
MAINVNTVYTTVLSILNKEQRGYLTPDEFNKVATQVQLELFENFFEDYNQFLRMPKTDSEFASRVDHILEEFQVFQVDDAPASAVVGNVYSLPIAQPVHRFGSAFYTKGVNSPEIEIVSSREYTEQRLSPILQPTTNFPVAKYQQDKLTVFPAVTNPSVNDITFNYVRKPKDVVWGYKIGGVGQYIYEPTNTGTGVIPTTGSVDFEISESQQTEVVLKVLQYAGVIIRDQTITNAATNQLATDTANEKQ